MSLMPSILGAGSGGGGGGDPGDGAQLPGNEFFNEGFDVTIYSGVQFNANGDIEERQATGGGWSKFGSWLVSGTNTTFYLRRAIDSGSLTTDAGGSIGDLRQMDTTRVYDVQKSNNGTKICVVTFSIVNAADNAVFATRSYTFEANRGLL